MNISQSNNRNIAASASQIALRLYRLDGEIIDWLAKHSLTLLRLSIGIVYVWFGALKLFPGVSPIQGFIFEAMGFMPLEILYPLLAVWEVAVGLLFLSGKFPRLTILLMLTQMVGAMSPLVLRPDLIFVNFPYQFTLVGQYIVKDVILVSAALVLAAAVRKQGR